MAALFFAALAGLFAAPRPLTSFAAAARAGDVAMIRELRARGDDPNERSGGNGWTPLLHAIHRNELVSVNALLDAGADPNRGSDHGMTPLMMAAGYGYNDIVQLLVARGANARVRDDDGETALDYALSGMTDIDEFTFFRCQDGVVRTLVRAGARAASTGSLRWAKFKRCESASLVR